MRFYFWKIGFSSHCELFVYRFWVYNLWNSSCKLKITGKGLILLVDLHSYMNADPWHEYFSSKTERTVWLQQQQHAEYQQFQFSYSSVPRHDSERVKWHWFAHAMDCISEDLLEAYDAALNNGGKYVCPLLWETYCKCPSRVFTL